MNDHQFERFIKSVESIEKSLRSLAEDSKVGNDIRKKVRKSVSELEAKVESLKNDPFGLNEGGNK